MSTNLSRLKQIESVKNSHYAPDSEPSKPSKGTYEPFEGTGTGHSEKKIIDAEIIAPPAPSESATAWRWLLHYPDHDAELTTTPESTLAEVLRDFPGVIAAEPMPVTPKRDATFSESKELAALVNLIYASDTEADQAEALAAALADPDGALICYRSIRDTPGTRPEHPHNIGNTIPSPKGNEARTAHPDRRTA